MTNDRPTNPADDEFDPEWLNDPDEEGLGPVSSSGKTSSDSEPDFVEFDEGTFSSGEIPTMSSAEMPNMEAPSQEALPIESLPEMPVVSTDSFEAEPEHFVAQGTTETYDVARDVEAQEEDVIEPGPEVAAEKSRTGKSAAGSREPRPVAARGGGAKTAVVGLLMLAAGAGGGGAGAHFLYDQPQLDTVQKERDDAKSQLQTSEQQLNTERKTAEDAKSLAQQLEGQLANEKKSVQAATEQLTLAKTDATSQKKLADEANEKLTAEAKLRMEEEEKAKAALMAKELADAEKIKSDEAKTKAEEAKAKAEADAKRLLEEKALVEKAKAAADEEKAAAQRNEKVAAAARAKAEAELSQLAATIAKAGGGSQIEQTIKRLEDGIAQLAPDAQADRYLSLSEICRVQAAKSADKERGTWVERSQQYMNQAEKALEAADAAPSEKASPAEAKPETPKKEDAPKTEPKADEAKAADTKPQDKQEESKATDSESEKKPSSCGDDLENQCQAGGDAQAADAKPAADEKEPSAEKPAAEQATEAKPAEEKPAEEKATEEKPTAEKPTEEKPTEEKPAASPAEPAAPAVLPISKADLKARLAFSKGSTLELAGAYDQAEAAYAKGLTDLPNESHWKAPLVLGQVRVQLLQQQASGKLPSLQDAVAKLDEIEKLAGTAGIGEHHAAGYQLLAVAHLQAGRAALAAKQPGEASKHFNAAQEAAFKGIQAHGEISATTAEARLDGRLDDLLFKVFEEAGQDRAKIPTDDAVAQYKQQITVMEGKLKASDTEKGTLNKTIASLNGTVKDRDGAIAKLNQEKADLSKEITDWKAIEAEWAKSAKELADALNFKSALPTADVRWSKQSVATRKWLAGLVTAGSAIQQHQHDAGSWVVLNSDLAKTLGLNPAGAKSSGVDLASWQAQLRAATETAVQSRTESERASQGEARLAEFVSVVGRDVLGFPESLPAPNSRWSTKTAETEAWLKAWNEALNKRLESSATYRQWYAGVGEDLYRKGDNAGAVRVFTDILKVEPRESNALGNRGTVLLIQGKVNEAIADFEQSLAVNPDNASVHFALAWAYAKNRVEAEARRHYDRAVELDPVWKDRPDPTRVFVPAGTQLSMPALSSLPMSLSSK